MAYSTQADLEKYLQVDFTAEPEPVVTLLLSFAKEIIDTYCDRTFDQVAGAVETLDGLGDSTLFLANWPVTAVNSVTDDGAALVEDTDFVWYTDGRLVRGSLDATSRWRGGRKSVVVNYDHGYATIPVALSVVSNRIAGRLFQASAAWAAAPAGASGVRSISLDGSDRVEFSDVVADVSTGLASLESLDTDLLSRFRRRVL